MIPGITASSRLKAASDATRITIVCGSAMNGIGDLGIGYVSADNPFGMAPIGSIKPLYATIIPGVSENGHPQQILAVTFWPRYKEIAFDWREVYGDGTSFPFRQLIVDGIHRYETGDFNSVPYGNYMWISNVPDDLFITGASHTIELIP